MSLGVINHMPVFKSRNAIVALSLILSLAVYAQSDVPTIPLSAAAFDLPQAYGPGEQLSYDISYLGISAGTVTITVGARTTQAGRDVWPFVAVANSHPWLAFYAIRDRYVTYWDAKELDFIAADNFVDENKTRRRDTIRMNLTTSKATVTRAKEGRGPSNTEYDIEKETLDLQAALFRLRNTRLNVGARFSTPIFTGHRMSLLNATVTEVTAVELPMGKRDAYLVQIQTDFSGNLKAKREVRLYISADPLQVPLILEADLALGSIRASLIKHTPGKSGFGEI